MTSLDLILLLRLGKFIAVAMLVTGSLGSTLVKDFADRKRLAYLVAGPGFGLTWIFGFLLMTQQEVPVLSTWILLALLLSFISIQGVLYLAGKAERGGVLPALFVLVPLASTFALMVYRPG